ncbi:DUF3047 domain-containing protein [Craterilacuibacter sp.]|uniref:DUF3047 domain-containing protein n=1 Tax=Craterilacuibacter sp. TaxID=2870909 RepID=UPI003F357EF2
MKPCKFALLLALATTPLLAADLVAGAFSQGTLTGWDNKAFKGETRYRLVKDETSGKTVLMAQTEGGASGQFRKLKVDLNRTPYLNWRWKISNTYSGVNERSKSGDDYPARVYVVDERGPFGISSRALNYVWSSNQAVGSRWPNAFVPQAMLQAVDSGNAKAGQWVAHKRNVREDLKAAFNEDFDHIDAVALMTDADNAGGKASAWYGDIWFSEK